jgi:hypothetical protein
MRFTRTACLSALTVAAALSTVAPALAAPGDGPVRLERPSCPPGERAVWVDRLATPPQLFIDPRTGRITWIPGEPEFHGWECQPILLRPVQP